MTRRLFLDILERVFWTFIQGAASTLLLSDFLGIEAWKAAAVGGAAAVLALIKGIAASRMGDPGSGATLPAIVTTAGTVTGTVVGTTGEVVGEIVGDVTGER
jgi:hypothetical protein